MDCPILSGLSSCVCPLEKADSKRGRSPLGARARLRSLTRPAFAFGGSGNWRIGSERESERPSLGLPKRLRVRRGPSSPVYAATL